MKTESMTEEELKLKQRYELLARVRAAKAAKAQEQEGGAPAAAEAAAAPADVAVTEAPPSASDLAVVPSLTVAAVLQRPTVAVTPSAPPRPAAEVTPKPRNVTSHAELAALLAKRRGAGAGGLGPASPAPARSPLPAADAQLTSPLRAAAAGAAVESTPAAAARPNGAQAQTPDAPASAQPPPSTERRAAIKRPNVKGGPTPGAAGEGGKRSRLGPEPGGAAAAKAWARVGVATAEAGAGSLVPAGPVAEQPLPLRQVWVSKLPRTADTYELLQSMRRWGAVEEAFVNTGTCTGLVTFREPESARKLVEASEAFAEGFGPPVLVSESAVSVMSYLQAQAEQGAPAVTGATEMRKALVEAAVEKYYSEGGSLPEALEGPERSLVRYDDI